MTPAHSKIHSKTHSDYSQLPENALQMTKMSFIKEMRIKITVFLVKLLGIWKYPLIHDPDNISFRNMVYFLYKSLYPIIRAEKHSNLESYFKKSRDFRLFNLPKKFTPSHAITLSVVGDLMNSSQIENSKDHLYCNISDQLFGADVSFGNFESTLTTKKIGKIEFDDDLMPKINATEDQYLALKGHHEKQFTILNTANNHIIDCGLEGLEATLNRLKFDSIHNLGTQLIPEEKNNPLIITIKGIKLAFIGVTYSVNLRPYPNNQKFLVNEIPFHKKQEVNLDLIYNQMAVAKQGKCDLIILSLHWGIEYEFFPTQSQVKIVHQLAQDGIDLIISHHAHCVQSYELFQVERNLGRVVPIFYGIGNLTAITSSNFSLLSFLLFFSIVKGSLDGESVTYIDSVKIDPLFQLSYQDKNSKGNLYSIEKLGDWVGKSVEDKYLEKRIVEWNDYCELILGKGWKNNG